MPAAIIVIYEHVHHPETKVIYAFSIIPFFFSESGIRLPRTTRVPTSRTFAYSVPNNQDSIRRYYVQWSLDLEFFTVRIRLNRFAVKFIHSHQKREPYRIPLPSKYHVVVDNVRVRTIFDWWTNPCT